MCREYKPIEFVKALPRLAVMLCEQVGASAFVDILTDENYIVRISEKGIECGYASDKWSMA